MIIHLIKNCTQEDERFADIIVDESTECPRVLGSNEYHRILNEEELGAELVSLLTRVQTRGVRDAFQQLEHRTAIRIYLS